jgi:hypothetical protein
LETLRQTDLSASQRSILKALALAGEDGLVAVSIMNAGGYKSRDAAIKALANAGILMAEFIGLDLSASAKDGTEAAIGVIGYRKAAEPHVPLHLMIHKELREAVRQTL